MSFPVYQKYKASGVHWLGEVPTGWRVTPLKQIAQVVNGYPFDSKAFNGERGHPLVRIRDLGASEAETYYDGEFVEAAAITSDDVLIGMDGDFNVGRWLGQGPALLNQRVCAVRGASELITRLLEYALPVPLKGINDITYSTTVKHLSSYQVEKIRIALPSESEQTAIVAFLDRETSKIDALVKEQKQLIELLKEKRQAVISHAVTKGLSPGVRMKNSGVEWLGEVPEHWEMKRLKRLSPILTVGIVVNPSNYLSDEGLPFIYGGDIEEGRIRFHTARRISKADSQANDKTRLEAGDLLTVRVGAPGVTAVVPPECHGGNCASVMLIRRGEFSSDWLCYTMNSRAVRYQVELVQYGAAQEQFNISHAAEFVVPTPPREEQQEIADYLGAEVNRIVDLIDQSELTIALLQERRAAMVSAAITGKIDLREAAKPERMTA